jgi:hypothetical protein
MVWGIKKVVFFYQICCCFGWSFVCFGCFQTPKLPVSVLKRNNRNKRLVLDSAETSFRCFDTKIVSEDTLGYMFWSGPPGTSSMTTDDPGEVGPWSQLDKPRVTLGIMEWNPACLRSPANINITIWRKK